MQPLGTGRYIQLRACVILQNENPFQDSFKAIYPIQNELAQYHKIFEYLESVIITFIPLHL